MESGAIIDEIQRLPEIMSYMQTLVDRDKAPGRFIVTGSNQFLLAKHISQSLAGRIAIMKLLPFTMQELGGLLPSEASDYIYTGSYPRIYDEGHDPSDWYLNYIETYIEKDLKEFVNVLDLDNFRRFLGLLASSCGQMLNLSELGGIIGVSHNTIKAWVAALEQSYLVFLLQPYHRNFRKRIVKTPKLYFYDTGIACALLRIRDSGTLRTHHSYGALFENMVVSELRKRDLHLRGVADHFFWRDHRGREVDCVYEDSGKMKLIEIKAAKTVKPEFLKNLDFLCKLSGSDPSCATLVNGGNEKKTFRNMNITGWSAL